jgi:hypothetical protein
MGCASSSTASEDRTFREEAFRPRTGVSSSASWTAATEALLAHHERLEAFQARMSAASSASSEALALRKREEEFRALVVDPTNLIYKQNGWYL